MPKWPLVGYDGVTRTNGPAGFHAFGGTFFPSDGVEARAQQEVRDTYTASNLRVFISAFVGDAGADDVIMVFRTNGADDTQTVTVNGTGEFEDTSNTDDLVSGDLICMESDDSAQGHDDSWTTQTFQVTLDASSDVPPIMGSTQWTAATAGFAALQGSLVFRGTETDVEYTMRATRVLRDMRINVWAFGGDNTVIVMRKNQADTSLTVTITGGGEFLDTSNTASYVAGDEADYDSDGGGTTANVTVRSVEADTSSGVQMWAGLSVLNSKVTLFPSGVGAVSTSVGGLRLQIEAEDAATIQNLFVNCITFAANAVITVQKNFSDGNGTVSITGTGIVEDTSNTDSFVAEDDLSIEQPARASGTNGYLVAVEWETSVGPPALNKQQMWRRSGGVPGLFGRHSTVIGRSW